MMTQHGIMQDILQPCASPTDFPSQASLRPTHLFTPMLAVPQLEIVDESMLFQVLPNVVDPGLGELGLASHIVLLQRSQNPQPLNSKVLKHLQAGGKRQLV